MTSMFPLTGCLGTRTYSFEGETIDIIISQFTCILVYNKVSFNILLDENMKIKRFIGLKLHKEKYSCLN